MLSGERPYAAHDGHACLATSQRRYCTWQLVRDPVKNLVYYAAMEDLDTVFIDGTVVVEDGTVLHADEREVARRLQLWPQMAGHD